MNVKEKVKANWKVLLAALAIVTIITAIIVVWVRSANDETATNASSTTSTTAAPTSNAPGNEPRVNVDSPGGIYQDVPLVDGPAVVGDSTDLPNVRPLVDTVKECGALWDSWDDVVACKGNDENYMSSYDYFSKDLGFDRSDVEEWARVKPGYNAQYIRVSNWAEMENPARARTELVNKGLLTREEADKLAVRVVNCFMNTRDLETDHPEMFADCKRPQVRIALAPLVIEDKDGKPTVVRALVTSGTMADCGNHFWEIVIRQPSTAPPPPPETTTPPRTTIVTTTPPWTTTVTTTPPTTTVTTTTPPTTTIVTTTPPTTTLLPKPPTHHPQQPEGETQHPAPPRPVESVPPPPEPTPIIPELPTAAPTVAPPVVSTPPPPPVEPELPVTTVPPTTEIPRPGSAP